MNSIVQQKNNISIHIENAYRFLVDIHHEYGHFPLFDYYPEYEEKKHRGWHYMYRSPFIQASALDALLNAGFDYSDELIKNASEVLWQFREPGDLWRFWNVYEAEHPTFSDVDETSISSFALRKLGYKLRNKKILYSRIKKNGEIPTWINADFKIFKINPYIYCWLKYHNRKVIPILKYWKWITLDDTEPTIVANVVAYLGEDSRTKSLVDYVIDGWLNDKKENYQHYDSKVILAYHISRAYKENVKSFKKIQKSIFHFIENELHDFSFPELLMGYLSVSYFDAKNDLLKKIKLLIEKELDNEAYKDPYPYTTEKKKVYFGGSGALTAAWFLEVTKDW